MFYIADIEFIVSFRNAIFTGLKYFIPILYAIGCFISVAYWLNHFSLSPDSTNYITASENFAKHQSLFVYANWPSHSYEPAVEPYTEYMPGLPILSAAGFLFTGNPDTVMLLMNSISIALVYLISLLLLTELKFNAYFKIIFAFFLAFFEPFRFIFSFFWTETPFIFFSLLAVFFALKLLKEDKKKYWILGCLAAALSSFIKIYGLFNCAFFLLPFLVHKKKFSKLIYFVLVSLIFVAIWFIRNELTYGYFTSSHKIFQQFIPSNILRPFKHTLYLLGNDKLANIWAIILSVICLSPAVLYFKNRNIKYFNVWLLFIIGAAVNFFGIYLLSLISKFDYLESRLMAPVYILCLFSFIISCRTLYEVTFVKTLPVKYLFLILPVIFFIANPVFNKNIEYKINIPYPPEHNLWNEINQKGISKNSSHYITDFDYIHQIYGNKPQRIIPQDFMFINIGFLHKVTGIGRTPFIVLRTNELPYFYFERLYKFLNYRKAELQNKDFAVYVKN